MSEEEKKSEIKNEYYILPEKGSDAQPTGKQLVYRRGEFGERWRLMKASAETESERKHYADFELRDLKKEQVIFDKKLGAFIDEKGNKFSGNEVNQRNNVVRAKANLVIKEMKIKDPHYINKFMFSKSRTWNEDPIDEGENDWAHESLKLPEEIAEEKRKRFKKALTPIAPKPPETKVKFTDEPVYLKKEIAENEPSVEEIIKNRVRLKNRFSGIGALNPNRSQGLNYLVNADDDEIT